MLKYANKIAVQEIVKQASWWDSMKRSASDAWDGAKGAVREHANAVGNLYATAGNKLKAGWHGMTGNVQGVQDAQRAADQKWNAMKDHAVNMGKNGLSAVGHTAAFASGFTLPGALMHTFRGASMGGAKPAQPAAAQGITGYQAPPGGGLNAQYEHDQAAMRRMSGPTPGIAEAPAAAPSAAPKPAQAPVAAPKTQPAPAAPAPAAQGGLRLTDMGGPGLWNPSLTATQVNQNVGDPFADSFTMRGINPGLISTINQPASNRGGFDPSKITQADMNKWRHITGARNMNSEMDKWKTYEAMNGRGRQATNAAFRRARAAGYR